MKPTFNMGVPMLTIQLLIDQVDFRFSSLRLVGQLVQRVVIANRQQRLPKTTSHLVPQLLSFSPRFCEPGVYVMCRLEVSPAECLVLRGYVDVLLRSFSAPGRK